MLDYLHQSVFGVGHVRFTIVHVLALVDLFFLHAMELFGLWFNGLLEFDHFLSIDAIEFLVWDLDVFIRFLWSDNVLFLVLYLIFDTSELLLVGQAFLIIFYFNLVDKLMKTFDFFPEVDLFQDLFWDVFFELLLFALQLSDLRPLLVLEQLVLVDHLVPQPGFDVNSRLNGLQVVIHNRVDHHQVLVVLLVQKLVVCATGKLFDRLRVHFSFRQFSGELALGVTVWLVPTFTSWVARFLVVML